MYVCLGFTFRWSCIYSRKSPEGQIPIRLDTGVFFVGSGARNLKSSDPVLGYEKLASRSEIP